VRAQRKRQQRRHHSANAAPNDSQFFIRIPRLARLIHGRCEPLYAVVCKGAPPGCRGPGGSTSLITDTPLHLMQKH
jgi:hypothetical protein